MSNNIKCKNEFKAILLGETGTGKTSLINVSVGGVFDDCISSTLASSYVSKTFEKGKKEYILNLWDTNGQEKYRAMTKLFIKNSKIVIFVYSTDNRDSFENLKYWVEYVNQILGNDVVLGLAGNKSDLYMKEKVKEIEGKNYAKTIGAKFRLVSAKVDPNGFVIFLNDLLDDYLKKDKIEQEDNKSFGINKNKKNKGSKNCC